MASLPNSNLPFNVIKDFLPPGSFREAVFLGETIRLPNPVDSCVCKNRIEWVHVQDTSNSFDALLTYWKDFSLEFGQAIEELFPNTKMALTSFVDKPLPFLGYGWGRVPANLKKDYCYRNHIDFVDPLTFSDYVRDFPDTSGGNDAPENQFGAMINAVYDPNLRWSNQFDADGTEVIKIMSLMTNSSAHGIKVVNETKPDGTSWGNIPNLHNGYDLWWTAEFWNYSYGKQHVADQPTNRPYRSWVFPTKAQMAFHEFCGVDSQYIVDYVELGEKVTSGASLTSGEVARWEEVKKYCGPSNINEYIGVDQDTLGSSPHPGRYITEEECLITEYPNQRQVRDAWNSKSIHPIVQVIETDGDSPAVDWYRWAYNCAHDREYKCVEQFYKDIFATDGGVQVKIDSPNVCEGLSRWVNSLLEMVNEIWIENCNCETTTTTTSTTTTTTTTEPIVTTTPSTSCNYDPVCDLCDCITWPNGDIWAKNNDFGSSRRIVKGKCGSECSCKCSR